jgi:hypothetical protein
VTVGLTVSGWTISRRPLGRTVTDGFAPSAGTGGSSSAFFAQLHPLRAGGGERLPSAESFRGDGLAGGPRREHRDHRIVVDEVLPRRPVHILRGHPPDRIDIVVGGFPALCGHRLGPRRRKPCHGILPELCIRHLVPFRRLHQFHRDPVPEVGIHHLLHVVHELLPVAAFRESGNGVSDGAPGKGGPFDVEGQGLPFRHHGVQVPPAALENVREHLARRVILALKAREPPRDHRQSVREIGVHRDRKRLQGREGNLRAWRKGTRRDRAELFLHGRECVLRIHVSRDDEDGIIGGVPVPVEFPEHGTCSPIERRSGPQGVMGVWRPVEHPLQQLRVEQILRVRQIRGHLLLDRPPLLFP